MAAVAVMRHGESDVMECRVYPCGGNRTVGMICSGEARNISSEISVRRWEAGDAVAAPQNRPKSAKDDGAQRDPSRPATPSNNGDGDARPSSVLNAELILAFWTSIGFKPSDFTTTGMNEKRTAWLCRIFKQSDRPPVAHAL
jgi:hypothetical protein